MHDSYLTGFPWKRFREFISPTAERFSILKELLDEASLDYSVLTISGNRHFFVAPPFSDISGSSTPQGTAGYRSILVAHYDRAKDSPGANDNSTAVFLLIETAMKLKTAGEKNWVIIFTDKEELSQGESIEAQGSYSLAPVFKKLKMEHTRIFSFDACGAGDTLVISSTLEYLLKKEGNGQKLNSLAELRQFALDTARNLRMVKVLLAPTPFSDDAGFLRAGLAAQTITMLPSEECIKFVSELRRNPDFANVLISAELPELRHSQSIPETWRCLNTPGDSYLRLTPKNFRIVVRFAEALCKG